MAGALIPYNVGYVTSASSETSGFESFYAYNDVINASDRWISSVGVFQTGTGQALSQTWWQLDFLSQLQVGAVELYYTVGLGGLEDIEILGSDTGAFAGEEASYGVFTGLSAQGGTALLGLSLPFDHRYMRVDITKNDGSRNWVAIHEVRLYEPLNNIIGSGNISINDNTIISRVRPLIMDSSVIIVGQSSTSFDFKVVGNVIISISDNTVLTRRNYISGNGNIELYDITVLYRYVVVTKPIVVGRRYYCTLTGAPDIDIPISSINGRLRADGTSFLSIVCPNGIDYAQAITSRAANTFIIRAVEVYGDGSEAETATEAYGQMQISYAQGAQNYSITIQGRKVLTLPAATRKIAIGGIQYIATESNGLRRIRAALDKDFLPLDTAVLPIGEEIIIGQVAYIIAAKTMSMELTENG